MRQTLKSFADETPSPKLTRAVVRQLGGWCEDTQQNLRDIANHGVDNGFHGFIYYNETVKFTKRNRTIILDTLKEVYRDIGEEPYTDMGSWGCLKGFTTDEILDGMFNPRSEHRTYVYNALAWFAAETVAHWFDDWEYESKEYK